MSGSAHKYPNRYGSLSDNSEDDELYDNRGSQIRGRRNVQRYHDESDELYNKSSTDSDTEHDDDFGMMNNQPHFASRHEHGSSSSTRRLKTGRERRKKVARGNKGGDFFEKRRKRRVYFCTLAGEINLLALKDHLLACQHDCVWRSQQAGDALILVSSVL